jgi:hypothetical protein
MKMWRRLRSEGHVKRIGKMKTDYNTSPENVEEKVNVINSGVWDVSIVMGLIDIR